MNIHYRVFTLNQSPRDQVYARKKDFVYFPTSFHTLNYFNVDGLLFNGYQIRN